MCLHRKWHDNKLYTMVIILITITVCAVPKLYKYYGIYFRTKYGAMNKVEQMDKKSMWKIGAFQFEIWIKRRKHLISILLTYEKMANVKEARVPGTNPRNDWFGLKGRRGLSSLRRWTSRARSTWRHRYKTPGFLMIQTVLRSRFFC